MRIAGEGDRSVCFRRIGDRCLGEVVELIGGENGFLMH